MCTRASTRLICVCSMHVNTEGLTCIFSVGCMSVVLVAFTLDDEECAHMAGPRCSLLSFLATGPSSSCKASIDLSTLHAYWCRV